MYFIHILGLFYLMGFPEYIMKLCVLVSVIFTLIINFNRIKLYKFHFILTIFLIFILNSLNDLNNFFDFGFPFLIYYLSSFLYSLYLNFDSKYVKKHIFNLIIISSIGVLIKVFVHGIDESFLIGFMSMTAGEIGFLFPSLMLIFIFELIPNNKTRIYFFILLFLFGIFNEKRSIVFFFPLILSFYYNFKIFNLKNLVLLLFFYSLAIFLIPSLNPENKIFGSIDFIYPFEYALNYLTATYDGGLQGDQVEAIYNMNSQYGRFALLSSIIKSAFDFNLNTLLFGHGMGTFTINHGIGNYLDDNMLNILGYRGKLSTFLIILLDSGLIALITFIIYLRSYFYTFFNNIKVSYILLIIVFYDLITYSDAFLKILPISIYFFTLLPFVFNRSRILN